MVILARFSEIAIKPATILQSGLSCWYDRSGLYNANFIFARVISTVCMNLYMRNGKSRQIKTGFDTNASFVNGR